METAVVEGIASGWAYAPGLVAAVMIVAVFVVYLGRQQKARDEKDQRFMEMMVETQRISSEAIRDNTKVLSELKTLIEARVQ